MQRILRFFASIIVIIIAAFIVFEAQIVSAQNKSSPTIIRDTEIENIIRSWSEPIIKAAELTPQSIKFILIKNDQINAFVAGGQNVFIYTGLIQKSDNASEIVGVIAHELGHIRGGHLIRTRGALETASYESLIGTIFGIGAAIITGESGFVGAASAGFSSTAQRRFMAFSRVQEASADQAALKYLEIAKMSPKGLMSFMDKLKNQELLPASKQQEYVRTHPLTRNRISALEFGLENSPYIDNEYPETWDDDYKRIKAKLLGFLHPERVSWVYDDKDKSVYAQYARAIAAYQNDKIDKALELMDWLIKEEPDNPFFQELKGQMLVEFGRIEEAIPYYRKSIELFPKGGLLRIDYAHALIEASRGKNSYLIEAINNLQRAGIDEKRTPRIYRLLATAYGRLGKTSIAQLYLAEEALLNRQIPYAKRQAQTAIKGLEKDSAPWLRAQDILNSIKRTEKKAK